MIAIYKVGVFGSKRLNNNFPGLSFWVYGSMDSIREIASQLAFTSFSQPVSFSAGSFSFFKKSADESESASQAKMASSGTMSTGVFQDVEVSL
jgi:hypothetical protein